MIGSILIPMDTSSHTEAGLQLGLELCSKNQATLEGLAIVDEPALTHTQAKPLGASGFSDRAKETQLKEAFETAEGFRKTFEDKAKAKRIKYEFKRRSGSPETEIMSELTHADLLILGTKTYFKYATQREACDTFQTVTHNSFRPIVLVPEEIPPVNFEEAVIATDGSPASLKAVQMFALLGLAKLYTKITIISVSNDEAKAQKNTKDVQIFLANHGIKAIEKPIHAPDTPWEPVIGYIKNHNPSLLVMGVFGTGGLKQFFVGSFTASLIEKATIPMFTSR